jgi:hypothetical protein
MSESYINKLHYAELQGKYSVEGNNLDIVETLAIYASVPVKFANDGNGKKALWRKSLQDTVKKLMLSKENNTLSASQLRNPAYKNHIGLFTSDELYNPDMMSGTDEESSSRSVLKDIGKLHVVSIPETRSPMHEMTSDTCITPMHAEEKQNIRNRLEHMLSNNDRLFGNDNSNTK